MKRPRPRGSFDTYEHDLEEAARRKARKRLVMRGSRVAIIAYVTGISLVVFGIGLGIFAIITR